MPVSNVGDPIALIFDAIGGISVTATVKTPAGTTWPTVGVTEDTDPAKSGEYPYVFTPDTLGLWRVTFHATGAAVASQTYTVSVSDPTAGPAPFATSDDISAMWRTLTDDEATRADVLCRLASAIIRARIPSVDQRITDGTIAPQVATLVCAQMVIRSLRNPGGIASETNGPWSVTYGTGAQANTGLTLTADDIALLAGVDAAAMGRVGTITLSPARTLRTWEPGPFWHPV